MTAATLAEEAVGRGHVWIELPGVRVVDLSHQGAAVLPERLRTALEAGVEAEPDPRRVDFYEAVVEGYRYYFQIVPAHDGRPAKAFLLATIR
jgi:hypothetical protein